MKALLACLSLCLPLKQLQPSSCYGYRAHPITGKYGFHPGVDLSARHDTVFAVFSGIVRKVGYGADPGVYICLNHDSIETAYGHLSRVFVSPGEAVQAGNPIGITGSTGRVTGEHLHFSIRLRHRYINPLEFIYQKLINSKNHE